jgi:hypothetical protein
MGGGEESYGTNWDGPSFAQCAEARSSSMAHLVDAMEPVEETSDEEEAGVTDEWDLEGGDNAKHTELRKSSMAALVDDQEAVSPGGT